MKRITSVLLVLVMLVGLLLSGCSCSKKTEEPATEATQAPTQVTVPSSDGTVSYRHPLTGELLAQPWSGTLAAVMVNNIKQSMPQHGLSQADIIYEIEEESSITRNLAIYSDVAKAGTIGSIRSTRTYFVSVAASYDAYLVHCGASSHARPGGYDANGNTLENWKHLDQAAGANDSYFFRDKDRYSAGYAWEHTLFTTGAKLAEYLQDKEQSAVTPVFGFKEGIDLGGETANEITIKFKGTKTTAFTYDATTGRYTRAQHGGESVDGGTNQPETVKNVIAIYTNQWLCDKGHGHQYYDTIGSGEGYAATNGKIVPIKWSRASVNAPYTYTLADGSPLELDVGNSYIAVVGTKYPLEYK